MLKLNGNNNKTKGSELNKEQTPNVNHQKYMYLPELVHGSEVCPQLKTPWITSFTLIYWYTPHK